MRFYAWKNGEGTVAPIPGATTAELSCSRSNSCHGQCLPCWGAGDMPHVTLLPCLCRRQRHPSEAKAPPCTVHVTMASVLRNAVQRSVGTSIHRLRDLMGGWRAWEGSRTRGNTEGQTESTAT